MNDSERRTRPRIIGTSRQQQSQENWPPMVKVLVALDGLSRSPEHPGGWVDTGGLADAIGVSVGEAAARLRTASKQGLCRNRRSLRDGTSWKLTDAGVGRRRLHRRGFGVGSSTEAGATS
jgi:hypothetical protein